MKSDIVGSAISTGVPFSKRLRVSWPAGCVHGATEVRNHASLILPYYNKIGFKCGQLLCRAVQEKSRDVPSYTFIGIHVNNTGLRDSLSFHILYDSNVSWFEIIFQQVLLTLKLYSIASIAFYVTKMWIIFKIYFWTYLLKFCEMLVWL